MGVVTMSIHKLTAGSGYDYLTRQVAALDATAKGHVGLASYYTERGESPGVWVGSGLVGIEGLAAGDAVTAEQMWALFGAGMHPLATQRLEQLRDADLTDANVQAAARLGSPFKVVDIKPSRFRVEVARRIAAFNEQAGLPGDWPVSPVERARIRTEVARELFAAEYGRPPADARELAGTIAKHSRPAAQTVAGFDLTFSPVKSVSTLWAVADPQVAAQIEQAHHAAVGDALRFLEQYALFTREGPQGIRQVNVHGLIAAAFTHRDSRAGDPDLHTHVAVANKVQTLGGRWLSIDGRVLFKATVAASETYNTALEHRLRDRLGVRFADRPDTDPRKAPVREIVGVDPALNQRWSTRRVLIKHRQGELAGKFQQDHGRPPTPVEALQLAQQATLETRESLSRCLCKQVC
jgi:conjugative relaxase-like TrwC/TraI family protein